MGDYQVDNTGMIDTDITFNPKTMDWFFVIDGWTYTFTDRNDAERMRLEIVQKRGVQRRKDDLEALRASQRARELDDQWIEETRRRRRRGEQPSLFTDGGSNLLDITGRQHWEQVAEAYRSSEAAGYEPEEIGEILYDLVKQLMNGQASD